MNSVPVINDQGFLSKWYGPNDIS